jgi:hypothetical protein
MHAREARKLAEENIRPFDNIIKDIELSAGESGEVHPLNLVICTQRRD